jgi:hypothetical protein
MDDARASGGGGCGLLGTLGDTGAGGGGAAGGGGGGDGGGGGQIGSSGIHTPPPLLLLLLHPTAHASHAAPSPPAKHAQAPVVWSQLPWPPHGVCGSAPPSGHASGTTGQSMTQQSASSAERHRSPASHAPLPHEPEVATDAAAVSSNEAPSAGGAPSSTASAACSEALVTTGAPSPPGSTCDHNSTGSSVQPRLGLRFLAKDPL